MKIIYYVHGTTTDNAVHKCSGWSNVELNDLGKEQAVNLGKNTPYSFDVLYTSDLTRAMDSAKLAFPEFQATADKRLRECNYGDLDGKDKKLVIYEDHIEEPFPNGESLKDVEERVREFLSEVREKHPDQTIGIIAHRAPQLALEVITKKISWEEANKLDWRKTGDWKPGWVYEVEDINEI